jgi:hypothetical protein
VDVGLRWRQSLHAFTNRSYSAAARDGAVSDAHPQASMKVQYESETRDGGDWHSRGGGDAGVTGSPAVGSGRATASPGFRFRQSLQAFKKRSWSDEARDGASSRAQPQAPM